MRLEPGCCYALQAPGFLRLFYIDAYHHVLKLYGEIEDEVDLTWIHCDGPHGDEAGRQRTVKVKWLIDSLHFDITKLG